MSELLPREKKAFVLHMSYSFLEGIIAGLIILNEFVFVKSLLGSNYQLAILFQFGVAVFLLLIFMNEWLKRIRNKRNVLRRAALLTRLPLILLLFFPRSSESLGGILYIITFFWGYSWFISWEIRLSGPPLTCF
jgi:Na+/melibiose symporter-like transporter